MFEFVTNGAMLSRQTGKGGWFEIVKYQSQCQAKYLYRNRFVELEMNVCSILPVRLSSTGTDVWGY